ncbi:hybrid-cluster NAD(P)-dependent oxidoreductase [Balneatrix alpica]|uniref:hybrid-cluster NAD(P)-dependent oxidoreductase n=1 Tax=Balneatrix alpica TaxID=75684 RepID=UPI00273865DC|nr:hybrid-cluster NAD(P)-dependent oxidoreductase [Balneatrix alpica]
MPHISALYYYPIKSSAPVLTDALAIGEEGPVGDRRYLLIDLKGQMLTARTHPQLQRLKARYLAPLAEANQQADMDLSYPGLPPLEVRQAHFSLQPQPAQVWSDQFNALRTHPDYDAWLSQVVGQPVQLLWLGPRSDRLRVKLGKRVSFADGYPLLLISQASLDDLNLRANARMQMSQFRPNLVVEGTLAFGEDGWRKIRIGQVEFLVAKPCSRCIMTTVSAEDQRFHPQQEPLHTLKQYRQEASSGELMFGQNLIALNEGEIRLGDAVEVIETQAPAAYIDNAPRRRVLRCVERQAIARDFVTFWLEAEDGTSLADYRPGQHLPLAFDTAKGRLLRYYTLSSSPSRPGRYAISVKRIADGEASNALHDQLQPGQTLLAHAPNGHFYWQGKQPALLLSAGSGVTPMLSILRYLADQGEINDLLFFHQARSQADLPAWDELSTLAAEHPGLQLTALLSQPEGDWQGLSGRLSREHLQNLPQLPQRDVYLCGPQGFMQHAEQLLLELGLSKTQIYKESFSAPLPSTEQQAPCEVRIEVEGWGDFVGDNQSTLLEQAELAGFDLPWSCRAGVCGSCKQRLLSGKVAMPDAPGGLSEVEQEHGYILTCCAIPLTDVVISED